MPQLKNAYQKIGMFGTPNTQFSDILPDDAQYQGDQIRGFGFLHDGSIGDGLRLPARARLHPRPTISAATSSSSSSPSTRPSRRSSASRSR